MKTYKGIPFPDHVAPLVRYMSSLNDHRETLAALSGSWDTLALLGHLSDLKTDMGDVRAGFSSLTSELLVCLAEETLARTTTSLGYQAQIAADVLVRNLFERTADIGFLATDAQIVDACASADESQLSALRHRFALYAERYTVYKDIVLLNTSGHVLTRLVDCAEGVTRSDLVQRVLATTAGYVETFAPTRFCGDATELTYSFRVVADGRAVGVLALVFDLKAEAAAIFERLVSGDEVMAFLSADNAVLLSSDPLRLPAGLKLAIRDESPSVRVGGQQYVASRRGAPPYQGYAGPGWSAVSLVPAELVFEHGAEHSSEAGFTGENIFSPRLLAVPEKARQIQRRLDALVWNGRIHQTNQQNPFSRSLLQEIATTGRKTKTVFETSSAELLDTVAGSILDESRFLASLSVDILDRNLYERANDCRWWASSPVLASMDAAPSRATLAHINSLYTVYTNVVLFDRAGVVIASSRVPESEGTTLDAPWVGRCLAVRDPLGYVVSDFAPSPLYGGRRTYIYAAPILVEGRAVGGVALVFDSEPQFEAMVRAALPARPGAIAAFVCPDGAVLSQTAPVPLPLPRKVLELAPGETWSGVLVHDGVCFSVGATASSGYREFKTSDGYTESVIGVVVLPCGQLSDKPEVTSNALVRVDGGTEVATFNIGDQLVGIAAASVVECIEVARAVKMPANVTADGRHVGYTTWRETALPLFDLTAEMGAMALPQRHALVLKAGDLYFGLLVTELGPIVELEMHDESSMEGLTGPLRMVTRIARSGDALVPVLSPENVLAASLPSLEACSADATLVTA